MAVTADDLLPEWRLRESYLKHAARAQLHRLWGIQDGDTICNLQFVDPALCKSFVASARCVELPSGENLLFSILDGDIAFTSADRTVSGLFERPKGVLPTLVRLDVSPSDTVQATGDGHRFRAAVHHFIGLVEHPARDPLPFRELLPERFSLGYTAIPISSLVSLDAWVRGALSSVVASEHVIHAIDVETLGEGRAQALVRMTSQALFPDGSGAISRNSQTWLLHDAPGDRFPRISEISIARDAVEFFGPAPNFEPRARP